MKERPIYDPEQFSRFFPLKKLDQFLHTFLSSKLFGGNKETSRKPDKTSDSQRPGSYEDDAVASEETNRVSVPEEVIYDSLPDAPATPRENKPQSVGKSGLSAGLAFFFAENPAQHAKLLRMLSYGFDPNVVGPNGDSLLHHVIRIGQYDLIPEVIRHGARLDTLNQERQTPLELYRAVGGDRVQDLTLLQSREIEAKQVEEEEPQAAPKPEASLPTNEENVSWASVDHHFQAGHATEIERLLDQGLNPNARLRSGRSLLGFAVEQGRNDIVDLLLKRGADPLRKDVTGQTPLQLARESGRIDLNFQLLCAAKRKPESDENAADEVSSRTTTEKQTNPTVWKSTGKVETTASAPQAEPAKPTVWKSTARNQTTVPAPHAELKTQAGEEPRGEPLRKMTETLAVRPPVFKKAESVIDRSAEHQKSATKPDAPSEGATTPAATDAVDNSRRLSEASFYIRKSRTNDLAHLLEAGLDPNASLANGHSLLHAAVETYCVPIIDLLLVHGADPKRADASGVTAVKVAQNLGRADLAFKLLNAKPGQALEKPAAPAPVPKPNPGPATTKPKATSFRSEWNRRIAIHETDYYIRQGRAIDVERWLSNGLDPNALLDDGKSLLRRATELNKREVVEVLLRYGADPRRQDEKGYSALEAARIGKNEALVSVFEQLQGLRLSVPATPSEEKSRSTKGKAPKPTSNTEDDPFLNGPIRLLERFVREGQVRQLKDWLDRGLDANSCLPSGRSLLRLAVENDAEDVVALLLQYGADPSLIDETGIAPVWTARAMDRGRVLQLFKRHEAMQGSARTEEPEDEALRVNPFDAADQPETTVLTPEGEAPQSDHEDAKAPEAASTKNPLAAPPTFSVVTAENAEPGVGAPTSDVEDDSFLRERMSFLENYIRENRVENLKELLDRGLDANACLPSGRSLLRFAFENDAEDVVALLLQYGADPYRFDETGIAPIGTARARDRGRVLELFQRHEAMPGSARTEEPENEALRVNPFDAADQPETTVSTQEGEARQSDHEDAKAPEAVSWENPFAAPPAFFDMMAGSAGPGVGAPTSDAEDDSFLRERMSFLENYIRENRVENLKELLDRGLDANAYLPSGRSLLRLAVQNDVEDIVAMLLQYGADPSRLDETGVAPIWMARTWKQVRALQRFKRHEVMQGATRTEKAEDEAPDESRKALEAETGKDKSPFAAPIEDEEDLDEFDDDEEDDMVPFGRSPFARSEPLRSEMPKVAAPVPYTAEDGGPFSAIDESDEEDEDDFVSGLGDVNVTVQRELVNDATESAVGLCWEDCVIAPEEFEDAWEGLSLLPIPIDEKNRFRRWCTGERPDVKEFREHAEMMHMLALYADSYLDRR